MWLKSMVVFPVFCSFLSQPILGHVKILIRQFIDRWGKSIQTNHFFFPCQWACKCFHRTKQHLKSIRRQVNFWTWENYLELSTAKTNMRTKSYCLKHGIKEQLELIPNLLIILSEFFLDIDSSLKVMKTILSAHRSMYIYVFWVHPIKCLCTRTSKDHENHLINNFMHALFPEKIIHSFLVCNHISFGVRFRFRNVWFEPWFPIRSILRFRAYDGLFFGWVNE